VASNLFGNDLCCLEIDIADGDFDRLPGQCNGDGAPYSAAATSDDSPQAFQFSKPRISQDCALHLKQHGDHIATKTYKSIENYV
jgi:hypothetical protein